MPEQMLTVDCGYCKQPFEARLADAKRGAAKFCSYVCAGLVKRKSQDYFWSRFNKIENGCWLWTGPKNNGGYGKCVAPPPWPVKQTLPIHRIAWEITHGPIPKGLCVCHRCDVKHCGNPAHLFLGTNKENSEDMVSKQRQSRGEFHPKAKISTDGVVSIRQMWASGVKRRDILKQFPVSANTIYNIVKRKTRISG